MNKQELIERIESLKNIFGNKNEYIKIDMAVKLISELDEPEKVKIPQIIDEYIEQKKYDDYHLLGAMIEIRSHKNKEINEWFEEDDNIELFARAWLDGYEVEEEPKYTVKFKATNQYLCDDDDIGLHISPSFRSNFRKSDLKKLSLTEVFDSPLFEVEEV
ncbi:DUF1642 domain-containing protein [Streptococcus sp. V728]|uniref:DUF1642 domain-containing protein n=1 Tax=Streptococcus sp. V728 TaxID=3455700 RepID=UPI003F8EA7E6